MREFEVYNRVSGESLGRYKARTAEGAIEAMSRDAGYRDSKHMCAVTGTETEELAVEEIIPYE